MRRYPHATLIGLLLCTALLPGTQVEEVDYSAYYDCKGSLLEDWEKIESRGHELVVTARYIGDRCEPEVFFQLRLEESKQPMQAQVVLGFPEGRAKGAALGQHAEAMEELPGCPQFVTYSIEDQLKLSEILEELRGLRPKVVREPILWLHGDTYNLDVIGPYSSSRIEVLASPESDEPIADWFRKLFAALRLDQFCAE